VETPVSDFRLSFFVLEIPISIAFIVFGISVSDIRRFSAVRNSDIRFRFFFGSPTDLGPANQKSRDPGFGICKMDGRDFSG
jgi:hypothetical protein